jgi:hypothetical protein
MSKLTMLIIAIFSIGDIHRKIKCRKDMQERKTHGKRVK